MNKSDLTKWGGTCSNVWVESSKKAVDGENGGQEKQEKRK